MKNVLKYFLMLIVISVAVLSFPFHPVNAKIITLEKGTATVAVDEVVDDDLFIGAQTVDILGIVNGDVYIGAQTVRIDGVVNGDLHIGAATVTISGSVRDDVYIGAATISISNATIGDSLLVGAGNVILDEGSSIGGSLIAGIGTMTVQSPVQRNVFAGAGSVDINSSVGGEVRIGAGSVTIGPKANIAKDFYYAVGDEEGVVTISDSAVISGTVTKLDQSITSRKEFDFAKSGFLKALIAMNLVTKFVFFLGALVIGFLSLRLLRKPFTHTADFVRTSFLKSVGVGLITSIVIGPVLLLLAFTGIGLPLAGVLLGLFSLSAYMAKIVTGMGLGVWLSSQFGWNKATQYATLTLGLFLIYVIKFIPIFGGFCSLLVFVSGLGAIVLYVKSRVKV